MDVLNKAIMTLLLTVCLAPSWSFAQTSYYYIGLLKTKPAVPKQDVTNIVGIMLSPKEDHITFYRFQKDVKRNVIQYSTIEHQKLKDGSWQEISRPANIPEVVKIVNGRVTSIFSERLVDNRVIVTRSVTSPTPDKFSFDVSFRASSPKIKLPTIFSIYFEAESALSREKYDALTKQFKMEYLPEVDSTSAVVKTIESRLVSPKK